MVTKKKWTVMALVDASYIVGEFEAETGEEAAEKAWDEAHSPSLCHQCSDELETGDVYDLRAWTDDGDSYEGEVATRMAELEAERDRLRAELEEAKGRSRAWARKARENGKERDEARGEAGRLRDSLQLIARYADYPEAAAAALGRMASNALKTNHNASR